MNSLNENTAASKSSTVDTISKEAIPIAESVIKFIANKYTRKGILEPFCKITKNDHCLLIHLKYKRNTDLNPIGDDISFLVTCQENYPQTPPVINCLSTFCSPTLFDNRNLLFSILNHNWVNVGPTQFLDPIEEIILKIPHFINRVLENTYNKILVYYGTYQIDMVYNINDFLASPELDLYKVSQFFQGKKEKEMMRYVIVSDIYFLLFDPDKENKNMAKLIFWGDIRQIATWKGGNIQDKETVILEWKGSNKNILFELQFLNQTIPVFISNSLKKIQVLKEKFKIFQDDIAKPNEDENLVTTKSQEMNNANSINIDKLLQLIKYKEDLFEKQKSLNLIRELMNLYQQVIEALSARGDTEFTSYLEKLHKMLLAENIQEELERESSKNSKQLYEMSVAYDEEEGND